MSNESTHWPLQSARDQPSQRVKVAPHAPQTVTVHGKKAAAVLSPQHCAQLKNALRQALSEELLPHCLLHDAEAGVFERDHGDDVRRNLVF